MRVITIARKPLGCTVAENVTRYGTGGLNIDACRIACPGGSPSMHRRDTARRTGNAPTCKRTGAESLRLGKFGNRTAPELYMQARPSEELGRWPANIIVTTTESTELEPEIFLHVGLHGEPRE